MMKIINENQSSSLMNDGVYHRPENSIPTMVRYGVNANSKENIQNIERKSDIPLALSYNIIDDYTKIPQTVFLDWQKIISMNDNPGTYHNFITTEKRLEVINHIRKWKIANNY